MDGQDFCNPKKDESRLRKPHSKPANHQVYSIGGGGFLEEMRDTHMLTAKSLRAAREGHFAIILSRSFATLKGSLWRMDK